MEISTNTSDFTSHVPRPKSHVPRPKSQVVIVGRGAIGAIYCEAFGRADGVSLRVAVDNQRLERYQNEDFRFNNQKLNLNYFTPKSGDQTADLILIATKWEGYADALSMIEPIVGDNTLILPLLNGLLPYQMAETRYGAKRTMRGYYIGHTAMRDGNDAVQDGAYRTVMGEAINIEGQYSDRLLSLIGCFDRCNIKYRVDEDMDASRWLKFVINLGLNQTSALDGGLNYGEIRASKHYTDLCHQLMDEGAIVARHLKINGADTMSGEARKLLDTLPDAHYSSMAQDIKAGRTTEWPIFGGYLLSLAEDLGIELPAHQTIDKMLTKTFTKR